MDEETNKSLTERLRDTHNNAADNEILNAEKLDDITSATQFILCRCGDTFVSFPIKDVRELVATGELDVSFLPTIRKPNVGMVRRKGELIPLSSLASVIGASENQVSRTCGRAVVCHIIVNGKPNLFGLLVDEVVAVVAVDNHSLSSVSQKVSESIAGGVGLFQQIFQYENKEYRVIDVSVLYRFLADTIKRRKVIE